MDYDTTIKSSTRTSLVDTMHTDCFDWSYDFEHPSNWSTRSGWTEENKKAELEKRIAWLRAVEENPDNAWASNYGGWPRIWHKVIGFGMASAWPYWKPRPTLIVSGTLGAEWLDWNHITGVQVREPKR